MNGLKPCPFCGGAGSLDTFWGRWYRVTCLKCGASGAESDTEQNAADAWNQRAGEEAPQ